MSLSVFQMLKIGIGPSSSHTVGPMKAAKQFVLNAKQTNILDKFNIRQVKTELFGSLALTGKGHSTDKAIVMGLIGEDPENVDTKTIYNQVKEIKHMKKLKILKEKDAEFSIVFHKNGKLPYHTNGMRFSLIDDNGTEIFKEIYYSPGGGFIISEKELSPDGNSLKKEANKETNKVPYPFTTADELFTHCRDKKLSVPQIILENEKTWRSESEIMNKLDKIWQVMNNGINNGLNTPGLIPGALGLERRAPELLKQLNNSDLKDPKNVFNWINCWALAVSEENSVGGQVVTAPTNGSAGVIPSVINYYLKFYEQQYPNKIHDFLMTAAAIGMIIKINATVSGAEGGCQAEIGAASAMAAGALTAVLNGNLVQIENAAEIALEHFLGLTCDPIGGVVQIPCIERNAVGAVKAINASALSLTDSNKHKVSLDRVIKVMKKTGDDMKSKYKETSKGGIAEIMSEDFKAGMKLLKSKHKHKKGKLDEIDLYLNNTLC